MNKAQGGGGGDGKVWGSAWLGVSGFQQRVSSWPGRLGAGSQRPHPARMRLNRETELGTAWESRLRVVLPGRPLPPQPAPPTLSQKVTSSSGAVLGTWLRSDIPASVAQGTAELESGVEGLPRAQDDTDVWGRSPPARSWCCPVPRVLPQASVQARLCTCARLPTPLLLVRPVDLADSDLQWGLTFVMETLIPWQHTCSRSQLGALVDGHALHIAPRFPEQSQKHPRSS